MRITVYDRPEFPNDQYTVVIERGEDYPTEFWGMGSLGNYYFSGDSRDKGYKKGAHLGKKVCLSDLSEKIQRSILTNLALLTDEDKGGVNE